jgi:D-sedoheptulose 7-phosphate isomerase
MKTSKYEVAIDECLACIESLRALSSAVQTAAELSVATLRGGGKLLICGNGGSAATAQHLTGELVGRYKSDRAPLAAVTLSADAAVLTCIGNDYCFDEIFSRQVYALGRPGDLFVALSASGQSVNILRALSAAREAGMQSIAFLGSDGGMASQLADCTLVIPNSDTARIQEGHQFLLHCLMDQIEYALHGEQKSTP